MRHQYKTDAERDRIIKEQTVTGLVLIEEQNIIDGNFLIFADKHPETTAEVKTAEAMTETRIEELIERKIKEMVDGSVLNLQAKTKGG